MLWFHSASNFDCCLRTTHSRFDHCLHALMLCIMNHFGQSTDKKNQLTCQEKLDTSRVCSAGGKPEASSQQLSNMTHFISGPSEILRSDCSGIGVQIVSRLNGLR